MPKGDLDLKVYFNAIEHKKGQKIMRSMKKTYGKEAEAVFYASKNKGVIKGVEKKKRSQSRNRKKTKR